jgi:hypothetical protein
VKGDKKPWKKVGFSPPLSGILKKSLKRSLCILPEVHKIIQVTQAEFILNNREISYSEALNRIILAFFYGMMENERPRRSVQEQLESLLARRIQITDEQLTHYRKLIRQLKTCDSQ